MRVERRLLLNWPPLAELLIVAMIKATNSRCLLISYHIIHSAAINGYDSILKGVSFLSFFLTALSVNQLSRLGVLTTLKRWRLISYSSRLCIVAKQ